MQSIPDKQNLVVFRLDEQGYALFLTAVERVIRAVEITPLPKAPEIVLGAINAGGRIIPVIDVRRRFRLPERELSPEDRFILARASRWTVALVVDAVEGAREFAGREVADAGQTLPFAEYLAGVAKTADGLILIHDLDKFLSLDEARGLDEALSGGEA